MRSHPDDIPGTLQFLLLSHHSLINPRTNWSSRYQSDALLLSTGMVKEVSLTRILLPEVVMKPIPKLDRSHKKSSGSPVKDPI